MPWPLSQDYNELIQNPQTCFADPELRGGQPVVNTVGIPMPRSGNFADVYEFFGAGGGRWAVKCFTRQIPGLPERYREISQYLQQVKLPFMVDFTFLDRGIRVRGDWFPVVKMQWVDGLTLNQFVRENLERPQVLEFLCQLWVKLAQRLREANLAHCDLQHGNVLLVPAGQANALALKLVDYDGMCVPSLTLLKSIEVGHAAYQHPQRQREGIYSMEVDRFSHLVIYTALRGLVFGGPSLWERYDTGDNLLFRREDFQAPRGSELLGELLQAPDSEVRRLAAALGWAAQQPLDRTPLLADLVLGKQPALASPSVTPMRQQAAVVTPMPRPPTLESRSVPVAATVAADSHSRGYGQESKPRWPMWAAFGSVVGLLGLIVGIAVVATGSSPEANKKGDLVAQKDARKPTGREAKTTPTDAAGSGDQNQAAKAPDLAPPNARTNDDDPDRTTTIVFKDVNDLKDVGESKMGANWTITDGKPAGTRDTVFWLKPLFSPPYWVRITVMMGGTDQGLAFAPEPADQIGRFWMVNMPVNSSANLRISHTRDLTQFIPIGAGRHTIEARIAADQVGLLVDGKERQRYQFEKDVPFPPRRVGLYTYSGTTGIESVSFGTDVSPSDPNATPEQTERPGVGVPSRRESEPETKTVPPGDGRPGGRRPPGSRSVPPPSGLKPDDRAEAKPDTKTPTPDQNVKHLSGMQEFDVKVAEGRFAKKGNLGYSTADGSRIKVDGKEYPNGLSMNPLSNGVASAKYKVGKKARTFITTVALHDSASRGVPSGRIPTPLTFQVFGDGKLLWKSKPVDIARSVQECEVDVTEVDVLELRIDCPGSNTNAQAAWLEPRVLLK